MLTSNRDSCVNNSNCGWCGDRSRCIPGTARGPLAPCLKNTFVYQANSKLWNPLNASTVNIHVKEGIQVVGRPDMSRAPVNSPYN